MMKLWLRRILAFHMAFLILAVVNCQCADEELSSNDASSMSDEDEKMMDKETSEYIDNRIDAMPTYVSGVERFLRAFMAPFEWITHATSGRSSIDRDPGENHNFFQGFTNPFKNFADSIGRSNKDRFADALRAIYPGTEWCGAGNVAKNPDEVGLFKKTDTCCKQHDQCNVTLKAGTSERGLRNNGMFTRSHCLCDAKFYYCLKDARSIVATNIGVTYFTVLRPQCFKREYPAFCVRYGRNRLRTNKCLQYDYDYSQKKTWQWFDSPDFQ